jgi:hypothetical protein
MTSSAHQKFLKFEHNGNFYKLYAHVLYAHLRSKQSESAVYFDDNILFGNEFEDCLKRNCFFTKAVRFHNTR